MRYLIPIFESLSIKEYFDQLSEKTGIIEMKEEIDELFLDLKDNFLNAVFNKPNEWKSIGDLKMDLQYKLKNKRTTSINITYYLEILKSGRKPYSDEIQFLRSFLDKCEMATQINMDYWVGINILFKSQDEVDQFKQEVSNIKIRGESLGYEVHLNNRKAKDKEMNSVGVLFPEDVMMDDESWRCDIWILFESPVDKDRLKSTINISNQVPSNIVSDFEEFTNRYRMPSRDKQELINIIKKGNWS
jgi:hypothetical protein